MGQIKNIERKIAKIKTLSLPNKKQEDARIHQAAVPNKHLQIKYGIYAQLKDAIYQRRLFALSPFFMLFGLILYKNTPVEPQLMALIFIGVSLLALLAFQTFKGQSNPLLLLSLALVFGYVLLPMHSKIFGTDMLKYPIFGTYQAKVIDVLSNKTDGQRIVISDINLLEGTRELPVKNARLFVRSGSNFQVGDVIEAKMRFSSVPSAIVPGGYDAQFHSYFAGIGAYGTTLSSPTIIGKAGSSTFKRFINNMRNSIGERISAVLPQPSLSIALALIVGDQTNISSETREAMATSGLAHMLAISGLHLSLIAGGVYAGFRLFFSLSFLYFQHVPVKAISAIAGIFAALFYLALSGASVSATRATIMLILIFGAVIVGRRALTMRNVAFAALIIIFLDPVSVFRPSFQLSFAAVVALVGVYELIQRTGARNSSISAKIIRFFIGLSATSLIAGLATAIFAIYHFQQAAPLGILGNLAALPILTFIVLPAGFIAILLIPLGMEAPFLNVMGWGIEKILNISYRVTDWSAALNFTPILLPNSLVFALIALAILAFFITKVKLVGALALIPLIAIFSIDQKPDILIANSTKAIAIRGETIMNDSANYSLALISGRTNSFATDAWQENYQEDIGKKLTSALCDEAACFYTSPLGFSVSLVKSGRSAFVEDCAIADLVITRLKAPDYCKNLTQVIDIDDLENGGMHWLSWQSEKQEFIIRPAIKNPSRPWRIAY